MDKGSKLDFSGQHIYVGMDVHKKSWSVSIQTEQFEHKTFTQPPEVEKLTHYLQSTDSWVAGSHELLKPMSLIQAELDGIISSKSKALLREAIIARLINIGIDGSLLEANDLIVSLDSKNNIVNTDDNMPEVRICNFELLRRL